MSTDKEKEEVWKGLGDDERAMVKDALNRPSEKEVSGRAHGYTYSFQVLV